MTISLFVIWDGTQRGPMGAKGELLWPRPTKPWWDESWSAWTIERGELWSENYRRTDECRAKRKAYDQRRQAKAKAATAFRRAVSA